MGVRNYVKRTVKNNTNVKGWVSWDHIKDNASIVKGFFQDLQTAERTQPAVQSDFNETIQRLGWSEKDLQSRMRNHLIIAVFSTLCGVAALAWFGFLLSRLMFLSSLVSLSLSCLMFAYAFREHFSYFQLKKRRFHCTLKEWFSSLIGK